MKKNRMMRLASGLLVAVLITTSAISGTFAKYVTEGTATDSARVAKWGVTVTGETDMFSDTYTGEAYTLPGGEPTTLTVQSDVKVVAPGTSGDLSKFALAGTPEVAFKVSYEVESFEITGWKYDVNDYIPLKITVKDGTTTVGVDGLYVGTNTKDNFEAAVKAAIENVAFEKSYAPGTNLSDIDDQGITISWEWPFETGNDEKDTLLGNAAAVDNAATISLKVKCIVTQID